MASAPTLMVRPGARSKRFPVLAASAMSSASTSRLPTPSSRAAPDDHECEESTADQFQAASGQAALGERPEVAA